MHAPEDRGGQAREEKGRRGRQMTGMRQGTRGGKREKGADRGDSGSSPNARSNSRRRVAPTGQCDGAGGRGEGGAPPAGGAVRGAGAHKAPALSPLAPGAGARHHLPAGNGAREGKVGAPGLTGGVERGAQRTTQGRAAESGRAGRTEQRSSGGAPRPAGGTTRESERAKWTGRQHDAGQG